MSKSLSRNDIRDRAREFAIRWQEETSERAEAQTFWNEFFAIFGVDRRMVALFEKRVDRLASGADGYIDLFWPGVLIAEHKSAGKSLDDAEGQALNYLTDKKLKKGELPRYVISSDFARIRISDLDGDKKAVIINTIDLPQEIDRFMFIAGYEVHSHGVEPETNIAAAQLMGRLYEEVATTGFDDHGASVLMTRILFLLFGDDTGMWSRDLFANFVEERTSDDGSDLGPQLSLLFQILDKKYADRTSNLDDALKDFPYVNGGLFKEHIDIPVFNRKMRDELLQASLFNWGKISPAVFGSLFQSIKSKEARRELGEHYTTEENIFRVIDPLILNELRSEFMLAQSEISKLKKLRVKLGTYKFFDPAMGCGNFLIVTYRELRRLELQIMKRLRELTHENQLSIDSTLGLQVSMSQFGGIEIEEWPKRIAETAFFLVDHQCNLELAAEFGQAPDRLPIETSARFFNKNALRFDWSEVFESDDNVRILSNPPFLGSNTTSKDQKEDQKTIWAGSQGSGALDYVTNWYMKAADYIGTTKGRAAFVSTNSITQGEQPYIIWGEKGLGQFSTRIVFAHRTFAWSSEAPGQAAVHCVIIGIANNPSEPSLHLWSYENIKSAGRDSTPKNINPYLVDAPWVVVGSISKPINDEIPRLKFGSMPNDGGHLSNLDDDEALLIRDTDPIASKYLRKLIGSQEMIRSMSRWCLWLVDADPSDIANSKILQTHVEQTRNLRENSKRESTKKLAMYPSLFGEIRQPKSEYLAVPRVSSENRQYVPFAFFGPEVIANDALLTLETSDRYFFSILTSSTFNIWLAAVSGRLKNDYRISTEVTFNNFPWPEPNKNLREQISESGKAILEDRARYEVSSLSDLYSRNGMPQNLQFLHQELDKLVLKAYGLKSDSDESTVLSELFDRYSSSVFTTPNLGF